VLEVSDRLAFERIFRSHNVAVFRYALRRVGAAGAQDVVAETFLVAWRRQQDISGDPLPWLLGVARRICANQLRGRSREAALEERIAAQAVTSVVVTGDSAPPILEALVKLSETDREALMLVAWDGLSNRQAAEVVGCSTAAFGVRVHRARRRLAKSLGRDTILRPTETDPEGAVAHDIC